MTTPEHTTHHKNLNFHLAFISKQMGQMLGTPPSQIYKEVIKNELDCDLIRSVKAQHDIKHTLYSRPKSGRPVRNCLENAKLEKQETGNKQVWGYMSVPTHGRLQQVIIHSFNVDKDGTYYDTQEYQNPTEIVGSVSIIDAPLITLFLIDLYDYIYVKTQGRVFRWKTQFGIGIENATCMLDEEITTA
jgi:hypothetical protein